MKYVYLVDGKTVHEIQPEKSRDFPDISIDKRFSADYLANCITVEDDMEVQPDWLYDKENSTFSPPPIIEVTPPAVVEPALTAVIEIPPEEAETLNVKIANQETRIEALETENRALKNRLEALEASGVLFSERGVKHE